MASTPRHIASTRSTTARVITGILGVIGELMLTLGIILGLFVFWQSIWTSFLVEGPRTAQVKTFTDAHAPVERKQGEQKVDAPPPATNNSDASIGAGGVTGILHVPRWNWSQIPVAEGTSTNVINKGYAGHYTYPWVAQPGELGNFSLAGHRRSFGDVFLRIPELQAGDAVILESPDTYYVYKMESAKIVAANDPAAITSIYPDPWAASINPNPTGRWMTLTTCDPEWGTSHRYIVTLKFTSWTPKSTGVPHELLDEPIK